LGPSEHDIELATSPNNSSSLVPPLSLSSNPYIVSNMDPEDNEFFKLVDAIDAHLTINGKSVMVKDWTQAEILLRKLNLDPRSWLEPDSTSKDKRTQDSSNPPPSSDSISDEALDARIAELKEKKRKRALATTGSPNPQRAKRSTSGTHPTKDKQRARDPLSSPSIPLLNEIDNDMDLSDPTGETSARPSKTSKPPEEPSFNEEAPTGSMGGAVSKEWRKWIAGAKSAFEKNPLFPVWPNPPLCLGWLDPEFSKKIDFQTLGRLLV